MAKLLKNRVLLTGSALVASLNVAAQSGSEEIEEVVVWGTEVNSSTFQLEGDALGIKQAEHISDLLRGIPGVDVGGAHSLNQRITIRSMDDKDLRITIDGANQNTYMYHHMGNLQIHADILKSVDINVGNNSVVNGGLGGSVWFQTREASDLLSNGDWGGRVQTSFATNGANSLSLTGYGQVSDAVDLLVYYNTVERDNYEVGGGKILDQNGVELAGTDGEVRGLEGDLSDALIKLGWNISDSQRFKIGYESYEDQGDYSYRPDMGLATDLAIANSLGIPLVYPTEFSRDTLTLNYDLDWGDSSTLKTSLFQNTSELWRDERGLVSWVPAFANIVEGEAKSTGLNVLANSTLGAGHDLTYGLNIINYETQYSENGSRLSGEDADSAALFIEDRIEFDNGWTVIPGLRYDTYDIDSAVVDDSFSDTTASIALEYAPIDSVLLRVSSTQLFKGPEIGEVFIGAGIGDAPNPEITAETGLNNEISVAYQAQSFALGLTVFNTQIDDYIYDYAGGIKDNVGDMEVEGFEAFAEYQMEQLTALITYASAESELSAFSQYATLDGARIDRQQGDSLSVNLDYSLLDSELFLHWDAMIVDDINAGVDLDGATLDNAKDGFTVHNIAIRWTPFNIAEGLEFTLGVDNVLDEFYASQSSRTGVSFHPRFGQLYLQDFEPGRNIKSTVSFRF